MSAHDPKQMTGDPNHCAERYENIEKCKSNKCVCVSDMLAEPCKCEGCGAEVRYAWMNGLCKACIESGAGLFA